MLSTVRELRGIGQLDERSGEHLDRRHFDGDACGERLPRHPCPDIPAQTSLCSGQPVD